MTQPATPAAIPAASIKAALLKCRRAFWYVALFSFCLNMLMLALPLYSLQVLDRVMASHSVETLVMLTLLTIAFFAFYALFSLIRSLILTHIGEWLEVTLAPALLSNAVGRSATGTVTSASQHQRDLLAIKGFVTGPGINTLFDAPWAVIFLLVIYAINPILGFLILLGSILLLILALVSEYVTKRPLQQAGNVSIVSMAVAEAASRNAETIEAMGMQPAVLAHWARFNDKNLELQNIAARRSSAMQAVSRFLRMSLQIMTTCIGGWLVLQNELSIGGMIAGSMLANRALQPFDAAIGVWRTLVMARSSYRRLEDALTGTPNLRGSMALPAPKGELVVENLFFRTPTTERPIIKAVSFKLNPGESMGIIGPSAAGKSTLAKLLIGVLPPSHGTVRLDGAEVFKWNREHLGPYVGYMPQDVELFSGTVKDNIARMTQGASDAKVLEAAQMAGAHEMILRLPKGYETTFSPADVSLSPGQRQRIGLARALFGNPGFLVLDEPNSNLDGDGERALVECLARLKSTGMTFVVVAHRPSIVGSLDKILVLKDGGIEQFGPRQQVLQKYVGPSPGTPARSVQ